MSHPFTKILDKYVGKDAVVKGLSRVSEVGKGLEDHIRTSVGEAARKQLGPVEDLQNMANVFGGRNQPKINLAEKLLPQWATNPFTTKLVNWFMRMGTGIPAINNMYRRYSKNYIRDQLFDRKGGYYDKFKAFTAFRQRPESEQDLILNSAGEEYEKPMRTLMRTFDGYNPKSLDDHELYTAFDAHDETDVYNRNVLGPVAERVFGNTGL